MTLPRTEIRVGLLALVLIVPAVPATLGSGATTADLDPRPPQTTASTEATPAVEPGLLDDLRPTSNPIVVQFDHHIPQTLTSTLAGLDVHYTFQSLPALFATAPAHAVRTLAQDERVAFIERADKPIEFDLDTATLATKAREVWDPNANNPALDTNPDPIHVDGEPVDGTGVGIAILDSGIDQTHPDFQGTDKVQRSFLATGTGVVEAPYFSPQTGHGTAVAGVAAGTGEASGGQLAGAAPGASLYSFAIQHAATTQGLMKGQPVTLYPAVAMDWILQNGGEQDPPIRVVNNAWHCKAQECKTSDSEYQIHNRLASRLAENGTVLTWSYGDSSSNWNPEATNPTEGILGVTGYNDQDLGVRNSCESEAASEGVALDPATWPDVMAPAASLEAPAGLSIASPGPERVPVAFEYQVREGTSLAAAHTAGAAALLLDANPSLNASEVEWLLEHTAEELTAGQCGFVYNFGDPAHPTSRSNHESGHGLIDAHDAVERAVGFEDIPDTNATAEEPNEAFLEPETRTGDQDAVKVLDRLYLSGDSGFAEERPGGDNHRSRVYEPNEPAVFSTTIEEPRNVSGIDAAIWTRVTTEVFAQPYGRQIAGAHVEMAVEQVRDGTVLKRGVDSLPFPWSPAQRILERPFIVTFSDPLEFESGDTLRLTVTVDEPGIAGEESALSFWEIAWDSARYPSHVALGEAARPLKDTYRSCRALAVYECTWIDADHPSASHTQDDGGLYELTWEGPGGSGAIIESYAAIGTCQIPQDVQWGECTVRTHASNGGGTGPVTCRLIDPAPPNEGQGRCTVVEDY